MEKDNMPPKFPKPNKPVPTAQALSLRCEWGTCVEIINSMEDFTNHMKIHLTGVTSNGIMEKATEYQCMWRDCEMKVTGHVTDFVRHVYFHSFHTKIKHIGSKMVENLKLKGCQLDGQSRNLIPELPERLQCGWVHCETIMDIPEIFYRHVDTHAECYPEGNHVPGGCRCCWEGCDAVSKSRYKLREHLRSHTQEKLVACPTCGGLFSNRTKFLDHLKRQEETDVQCYQCSHCEKKFTSERLLRDHVRHHVNQYKCPCCDMTCPTPSSLKSHLRYRHTNQTPFKCDHCGHGAKSVADLKKHMESHNAEIPFECHIPDCSYTSRTFQSLENHFKRIHQDVDVQKYKCHVCAALFTRGSNLTMHLKKKHKFRWPSGHSRFRYKLQEDGYLQLQTVRYESIRIAEQISNASSENPTTEASTSQSKSPQKSPTESDSAERGARKRKRRRLSKKENDSETHNASNTQVSHSVDQEGYRDITHLERYSMTLPCNGSDSQTAVVRNYNGESGCPTESQSYYQYISYTDSSSPYIAYQDPSKQASHVPDCETLTPVIIGSQASGMSMPYLTSMETIDSASIVSSTEIVPIVTGVSSSTETATVSSINSQPSQTTIQDSSVITFASREAAENYNLEMLGEVALLVPPEEEGSRTVPKEDTVVRADSQVTNSSNSQIQKKDGNNVHSAPTNSEVQEWDRESSLGSSAGGRETLTDTSAESDESCDSY